MRLLPAQGRVFMVVSFSCSHACVRVFRVYALCARASAMHADFVWVVFHVHGGSGRSSAEYPPMLHPSIDAAYEKRTVICTSKHAKTSAPLPLPSPHHETNQTPDPQYVLAGRPRGMRWLDASWCVRRKPDVHAQALPCLVRRVQRPGACGHTSSRAWPLHEPTKSQRQGVSPCVKKVFF